MMKFFCGSVRRNVDLEFTGIQICFFRLRFKDAVFGFLTEIDLNSHTYFRKMSCACNCELKAIGFANSLDYFIGKLPFALDGRGFHVYLY